MPELPEVETTRRGIEPHIDQRIITSVTVRQPKLRWEIPQELPQFAKGQRIQEVVRRGKYILLKLDTGCIMLHLGMSGSLRVLRADAPVGKHDHVDIALDHGKLLRLNDPRRFGAVLWTLPDPSGHPLLANLGPEPLEAEFTGDYLFQQSRGRAVAIKQFIMDGKVVVGVGNIYANEALFDSGIAPTRVAKTISKQRYAVLVDNIRAILSSAINQGGTTLRDFTQSDGKPGYFRQQLKVYGRAGLPCVTCAKPLIEKRIGQRSSVYCNRCQR